MLQLAFSGLIDCLAQPIQPARLCCGRLEDPVSDANTLNIIAAATVHCRIPARGVIHPLLAAANRTQTEILR